MKTLICCCAVVAAFLTAGAAELGQPVLSATRADGSPVAKGETVKTGDRLSVTMRLAAVPEGLPLSFYAVAQSGRSEGLRELFEIPGAPEELKSDPSDPQLYRADFTVPALAKERKIPVRALVAEVHLIGADTHDFGYLSAIADFACAFDGGAKDFAFDPAWRQFDFGGAKTPVQPGAESVTSERSPEGFRWIAAPQVWDASTVRQLDAAMFDWACAEKSRPLEFEVTVPPGTYRFALGMCAIGVQCWQNKPYQPHVAVVEVNGREVWRREPAEAQKTTYALMENDAQEDDDLYGKYLKPYVFDAEGTVEAPDGRIRVRYSLPASAANDKRAPLDHFAFWPAGNAVCERTWQRQLENREKCFRHFWKRLDTPFDDTYDPQFVAEADLPKAALSLFPHDNVSEWIRPHTRPRLSEVGGAVTVEAAPGERISGAMLLRAGADLRDVMLTAEGLPAEAKPRIWRNFRYWFAHAYWHEISYGTNQLLPVKPHGVKKDTSYGYLLRFDLPDDMRPGVYRGTVTATCASGERATVPVVLRVRDVRLPDLNDHHIAMINCAPRLENLRFCRDELGCTTAHRLFSQMRYAKFEKDAAGNITSFSMAGGPAEYDKWFKLIREADFPLREPYMAITAIDHRGPEAIGPYKPFTPEWRQGVKTAFGALIEAGRTNGFERLMFDLGGEIGWYDNVPPQSAYDDALKFFDVLEEEFPGIALSFECNCWASVSNFFPRLSLAGVRCFKSWVYSDRLSDRGKKVNLYTYSVDGRYLNGLHSWAHGAKGNMREWVCWTHEIPYNDLFCNGACGCGWHSAATPAPNGDYVPTLRSEAWRAAVTDRRYIRLLERAIAAAPRGAERTNAETFLKALAKASYDAQTNKSYEVFHDVFRSDGNYPHFGADMDVVRGICHRFAASLAKGEQSFLPDFTHGARSFFHCGLSEGPFARANRKALTGLVAIPIDETGPEAVVTVRDATGRAVFELPLKLDGKYRRFVIPSSDLGPGRYGMSLAAKGRRIAESTFWLVK